MTWSDLDHLWNNSGYWKEVKAESRRPVIVVTQETLMVAAGSVRGSQMWKYLKIKPAGLIEIRKAEGKTGLGNKIECRVEMVSVNCLLVVIKSNSCFHHQYQWSVSTDCGGGSSRYKNCRKHFFIPSIIANQEDWGVHILLQLFFNIQHLFIHHLNWWANNYRGTTRCSILVLEKLRINCLVVNPKFTTY